MSLSQQIVDERKAKFFQIVNTILFFLKQAGVQEVSQLFLHKVLWYADFIAYRDWNRSISDQGYQANEHGPTNKFLNVSGFPVSRKYKNLNFYSFQDNLQEGKDLLSFNEKALLAEICVILSPCLKNKTNRQRFYDFIHKAEPAYKDTWENNPEGDIDYEKSTTIQIDKKYREEVLLDK